METLVYDTAGLVHFIASIIALITGSLVLGMKKGTWVHRKVGYIYASSMLVLLITAFMIYQLFGGFGIFHIAAVVSLVTLIGGMVPVILRKPEGWLTLHFSFMYWSVLGLYAAFVSEVLTRIPETPFFNMVGLATGIIMFFGGAYFYLQKHKWEKQFGDSLNQKFKNRIN
ncbi:MAG TPA: DUF2306 domain-containing protein [Balneolaceae bacterium]